MMCVWSNTLFANMTPEECPITLQDVIWERQAISREVAQVKQRGLQMLQHIPKAKAPLIVNGISVVQNKLNQHLPGSPVQTNPPPINLLSNDQYKVSLDDLIVQYHTNRWLNMVQQSIYSLKGDLKDVITRIHPDQYQDGVWIISQHRKLAVPLQIPAQLCNDYIHVRYNMHVAPGEYWSRLHTQEDLLLLARLRYYDYLDVTCPQVMVVVYDAYYIHSR